VRIRSSISVASGGTFSNRTDACSRAGSIGNIRMTAAPIALSLVIAGRLARSMEHTNQASRIALYCERGPLVKNNVPILRIAVFTWLRPVGRRHALYRVDS
jgi:hypothetical protein